MSTLSHKRPLMPSSWRGWLAPWAHGLRRQTGVVPADPAPDFHERDLAGLAQGMRGELADVLGVAEQRLELVSVERPDGLAMRAVYRDGTLGHDYMVSAERHSITFERVGR